MKMTKGLNLTVPFLENPEKSPLRPPDQPFNDILIDSPEKKKLIKDTTLEKGRRLKHRIQEQQNEFISRGKVSRDLKQQDVDCLGRVAVNRFSRNFVIYFQSVYFLNSLEWAKYFFADLEQSRDCKNDNFSDP